MLFSKFLEILVKPERQKELPCIYFRSVVVFALLSPEGNNLEIYIPSIGVFKLLIYIYNTQLHDNLLELTRMRFYHYFTWKSCLAHFKPYSRLYSSSSRYTTDEGGISKQKTTRNIIKRHGLRQRRLFLLFILQVGGLEEAP